MWKVGEVFNDKYFTIEHYEGINNENLNYTGHYLTANAMSNPILKTKDGKKI